MGACAVGVVVRKWAFILPLLIGLLVACDKDDDCPVCPPLVPVSDYNFYISDVLRDNYIFVYNTAAQAITDSIAKEDRSTEYIAVTVDEKHLLLSTLEYGLTWVLDIESRQQIDQFDYGGELAVSADGRYIAIQGDSLRILNAATYDVVLIDTLQTHGGAFGADGAIFYTVAGNRLIKRYVVAADSTLPDVDFEIEYPGNRITHLVPVMGGEKLWVHYISAGTWDVLIRIYDFEAGSSRVLYIYGAASSDLELMPSGDLILATDPVWEDEYRHYVTGNIFMWNVVTWEMVAVIPPLGQMFGQNDEFLGPLNPGEIAVTPDGRYALVGSGPRQTPYFGVIDMVERQYLKYDSLGIPGGDFGVPHHVVCRKGLK